MNKKEWIDGYRKNHPDLTDEQLEGRYNLAQHALFGPTFRDFKQDVNDMSLSKALFNKMEEETGFKPDNIKDFQLIQTYGRDNTRE